MKAFVINLPHSVERKRHMERQVASLDHEFVEAVDGTLLTEPRPDWLPAGAFGATHSHRRVYRQVVAARLPHALVLEDDAVLPDDIAELAEGVASKLARRDVGLLYYRSFGKCPLDRQSAVAVPGGRSLLAPVDPGSLTVAAAYVITRESCERMLAAEHEEPDAWGKFAAAGTLEVRCVAPRPVEVRTDFASTIGYSDGRMIARLPSPVKALGRRALERRMSRFPVV